MARVWFFGFLLAGLLTACPDSGSNPGGTPPKDEVSLTCTASSVAVGKTISCSGVLKYANGTMTSSALLKLNDSTPNVVVISNDKSITGFHVGITNLVASYLNEYTQVVTDSKPVTITVTGSALGTHSVSEIPMPANLDGWKPLAFNNAGQVLFAAIPTGGLTFSDLYIWDGMNAKKIVMPANLGFDPSYGAFINSSGQVAFTAGQRTGGFYDGTKVVEVKFPPPGGGVVGLADDGTVLGAYYTWKNGVSSLLAGGTNNLVRKISGNGNILFSNGITKDGVYTPFSQIQSQYDLTRGQQPILINNNGMVVTYDRETPHYFSGVNAPVIIPKPPVTNPNDTSKIDTYDLTNNNEILIALTEKDEFGNPKLGKWLYNTNNNSYTAIVLSDYIFAMLLINDNGDMIANVAKTGSTSTIFHYAFLKRLP